MEISIRKIPNIYEQKAKDLETLLDSTEILVLGNSHTYNAINPLLFTDTRVYNAAFNSQPLLMDWKILQHYEKQTSKLKLIIIPISYFSLYWCLDELSEDYRIIDYVLYYKVANSNTIKNHSEVLSYNLRHNALRFIKYYFKKEPSFLMNALGCNIINTNIIDSMHTNQEKAHKHTYNINTPIRTKNINIVERIAQWAISKDINILFVTTPTAPNYYQYLDQAQYQDMLKSIDEILAKYPNCEYINDIDNKSFYYADFLDSDHLNTKGAEKYTALIQQYINERKLNQ